MNIAQTASPYSSSDFLKIIEKTYRCRRVLLETRTLVENIFYIQRSIFGKKLVNIPFSYYPRPPVDIPQEQLLAELIKRARSIGPKVYVLYKTMEPLDEIVVKAHDLQIMRSTCISNLYLSGSKDEYWSKLSKNLRQNLRTSGRKIKDLGFIFEWSQNKKDLAIWYALHVRLYREKHGMITQPLELFDSFISASSGIGKLLLVKDGSGTIQGGLFVLTGLSDWEYSWSAYNLTLQSLNLNTLLVEKMISDGFNQGVKKIGFGATPLSDEKLLYFKRRWLCEEKIAIHYYWNKKPTEIDLNKSGIILRKIYSRIPLFILKKIPRFIVPYLA